MPAKRLTKKRVREALYKSRGVITAAAKMLGVTRKHLSAYVHKDPDLVAARAEAREMLLDVAENNLYRAVEEGQPWAVQYTLSRLGKGRGFTERIEQEQSGELVIKVVREERA